MVSPGGDSAKRREAPMDKSVKDRISDTAADRARVRMLVASGQWKRAEDDSERFRSFAAKRIEIRTKSGAEAIQGDSLDFQPASFLPEGAVVRRAVVYVETTFGTTSMTGSGFMISPRLMITNQHVIPHTQAALGATITFDRELDELGRPRPTTTFALDPAAFALFSDEARLDYAVIAVGNRLSGDGTLADFSYCPLSASGDKHVLGMNTNIIQHPLGQRKLISIRKNLLVARTDETLLYETDTQVGSSGSPVFNDDWEVVALHHYGEPFLRHEDDAGKPVPQEVNEGIRISALVADLVARRAELPLSAAPLLAEALELGARAIAPPREPRLGPPRAGQGRATAQPEALIRHIDEATTMTAAKPSTSVDFVVPLRISVSLDGASPSVAASPAAGAALGARALSPAPVLARTAEAVRVDSDYGNRSGYLANFIPNANVPLPGLSTSLAKAVAPLRATEPNAALGELKYEHFSIKLNRTTRMAIFTATNIDGETYLAVDRDTGKVKASEGEKWFKDPRISESFTINQEFYSAWSTYFDRGHLTRRTDPTWGTSEQAERANADTYHFTNCSPQHFRFNETARYWQGVERYVLENGVLAQDVKKALCVFQGPIFDDTIDRWADDVQVPSSFFKVVVWRGRQELKAVGIVVDQGALLDEPRVSLGQPRDLPRVNVKQWLVTIASIEKRTGLDFGQSVRDADTYKPGAQAAIGAEAMKGELLLDFSQIKLV
ncbi:DNA/RNA non-specific endonuclease [Sphaerotilaceae bacterium SBD11-9]